VEIGWNLWGTLPHLLPQSELARTAAVLWQTAVSRRARSKVGHRADSARRVRLDLRPSLHRPASYESRSLLRKKATNVATLSRPHSRAKVGFGGSYTAVTLRVAVVEDGKN
jgi:hypothetical protein